MNYYFQISAGRTHSAAWTATPQLQRKTGVPFPLSLCVPESIPPEYHALRGLNLTDIHARFKLLYHFSNLVYSSWKLLPLTADQV